MENNIFDFATSELSQDAFICWCLNWHNCGKSAPLYPLAQDLLALMGEHELAEEQKLVLRKQIKNIDVLVSFQGMNKVLIIEDKTYTSEHDEQIAKYKETIDKKISADDTAKIGIDNEVKIETVYFKTGYHYDCDLETIADYKIGGEDFLKILKKYEGISEILDDFINCLDRRLEWYNIYGDYTQTLSKSPWDWNIANHHIAQHNLMKDLLRERFPISLWEAKKEPYKIRIGTNVGGRPWTEFTFVEKLYPNSEDGYCLFWRIDTDDDGPYISLRFYERFNKKDEAKRNRHIEMYHELRKQAQNFLAEQAELQLDWNKVSGGYSGGYHESTILTICLKESLKSWDANREIVKKQILAITDCFM